MLSASSFGFALGLLLAVPRVLAGCECGYTTNTTGSLNVFTEVLESDFTALDDISQDTDWVVQQWSVEPEASKGPYGRKTEAKNVVVQAGGHADASSGLELWVRPVSAGDRYVSVAEVDSARTDMQYGTFRAAMKTTTVNGTCAAFFWYLNDTQEIDMEFLSAQTNDSFWPVNLVLHSVVSQKYGGDASLTPSYKIFRLPFRPSDGFHEYRFDWSPGAVSFYADGKLLMNMDEDGYVPSAPGKIVLSHWSNGQPLWSGGPPTTDAKLLISYVKAYFNSSDPARQKDYGQRCKASDRDARSATCPVPDLDGPPTAANSRFFTDQTKKTADKHSSSSPPTPLPRAMHINLIAVVATMWILARG